jgi:hypothetical protein
MTVERDNKPGFFGGDYTVTVYLDDDGHEVDKEQATKAMVSDYSTEKGWLGESIVLVGESD